MTFSNFAEYFQGWAYAEANVENGATFFYIEIFINLMNFDIVYMLKSYVS